MKNKLLLILFMNTIYLLNAEMVGGYSGSELRYGSNAREFSLGGALIALSNPGFRQFSNPALISTITNPEIGISLFSMSLDRSVQSFVYNQHLPPKAGLGIAIFRSGTSNITGRNTIGQITENFSTSELQGILTFAVQFSQNFSLGFNLKIAKSNILDNINNNGISIDVGGLYKLSKNVNYGIRLTNLIGKYKWKYSIIDTEKNYSIYIPKIMSMGSKYTFNKTIIVTQIDLPIIPIVQDEIGYNAGSILQSNDKVKWVVPDNSLSFRLGVEQDFNKKIKLRLGINSNKIALGMGTKIIIWEKYNLLWDYAIDPGIMEEGISHNFSWRIEL